MRDQKIVCAHPTELRELIWSLVNSSPCKLVNKCFSSLDWILAVPQQWGLGLFSLRVWKAWRTFHPD